MERGKALLRWAGILFAFAVVSVYCIEAQSVETPVEDGSALRADQVTIDTLAGFGDLELPAVTFFHDRHTEVLGKTVAQNELCQSCHMTEEDGTMSLLFKRLNNDAGEGIMDIYHEQCIGCHVRTADAGQESGPLEGECRTCHNAEPAPSAWVEIGLDLALHARHVADTDIRVQGEETNCAACHHEYNPQTRELFWAKGKEGTCRYCHLAEPYEEGQPPVVVSTFQEAAHESCVRCHLTIQLQGKDTGPVTCAGCHTTEGQATIAQHTAEAVAKMGNAVPRLERGQPDQTLIMAINQAPLPGETNPATMTPVPFNHLAHEGYNDTCRVCHHASLDSCAAKCHTLQGAQEGDFVTLSQAMHLRETEQSCVGCHQARQAEPECAGCHEQRPANVQPDQNSCATCHVQPQNPALYTDLVLPLDKEQKQAIARMLLPELPLTPRVFNPQDIPETVTIGAIADQYQPATLPHRKIVLKLIEGMRDNNLANAFHSTEFSVCQGCHHNSPASARPPRCVSCHGQPFDARTPFRPGAMAAYHGQCMGCHDDMGLPAMQLTTPVPASTDCVGCHKAKN